MRRRLPFLRIVSSLTVVFLGATALVLAFARIDRVVIARGTLNGGSIPISTTIGGVVSAVHVAPGETVTAGAPLVSLNTEALRAERTLATLVLERVEDRGERARRELERLEQAVFPAELRQVERALERSRVVLASAEKGLERLDRLHGLGLVQAAEVDRATLERDLAQLSVAEAEQGRELHGHQHASRREVLLAEQEEADPLAREARARIDELDRQLAACTLVAPSDGVALFHSREKVLGRAVPVGTELMRLAVAEAQGFEGQLQDGGRSHATSGQAAEIRLDGYPWLLHGSLAGRVDYVSDRVGDEGGFTLRIELDPAEMPGPLYEGMRGEARVLVKKDVTLGQVLFEKLTNPGGSDGP